MPTRDDALARPPLWHFVVLILLPVAVTAVTPQWLFINGGSIDAWVYNGFFRHLPEYLSVTFPETYYGSRLGWILPGHLAYRLFDAHTASAILHLTFYYAAVLALYWTIAQLANAATALVAATCFGLFAPAVRALGWDYVDGAVITYALASVACTIYAARRDRPAAAVAAGAAAGAMVHSNIGALMLVPSLLMWFVPAGINGRATKIATSLWHWGVGVLVCTLVLAQGSLLVGGTWDFFMASVRWELTNGGANPWDVTGSAWFWTAEWLFVPVGTALAVVTILLRSSRRQLLSWEERTAIAMFGYTACVFLLFDYLGPGALLAHTYYATWLLPSTFIVLFVVVARRSATSRAMVPTAAAAVALLVTLGETSWMRIPDQVALALCVLVIPAASYLDGLLPRMALATALVAVNVLPVQERLPTLHADERDVFAATDRGVQFVDRHVQREQPRFLLVPPGNLNNYVVALTSVYLWGFTIVSDNFPTVTPAQAKLVTPENPIIVISPERAREDMRFDRVFAPFGLGARVVAAERIETNRGPLYVTVLRAHRTNVLRGNGGENVRERVDHRGGRIGSHIGIQRQPDETRARIIRHGE